MSVFTFGVRMVTAVALAFTFVAGTPAAAQTTGTIKGKVVDGKGQPVDKAAVTIEFKGGTNLKREVKTNKRGEFIQVGLQPGPYYITVQHEGGQAADQVQVGLGATPELNLTLKPATAGISAEEAAFRKTFEEGSNAMTAKNFDAAIAKFNEAIGMQADCYACYMNVGSAHYEKKENDKAEAAYKKAAELRPSESRPLNALAELYNAMGRNDEAVAMSTKAASMGGAGGGSAQDSYNQGVILWNANKAAEALVQFEAAVKADPNYADAQFRAGLASLNTGKLPEAAKYFENYLKLAPSGPLAPKAKENLDMLAPLLKPKN
jgi:tetratricopeptide (TPR) repeat protein